MIVEVYLSTKDLLSNQSLVVYDEFGKRWDVEDAVRSFYKSMSNSEGRQNGYDVILERWHIELGDAENDLPNDLGVVLPKVYKNSIVLFRSLFTMMNLLPAWKLSKKSQKSRPTNQLPKLHYRVYESGKSPTSTGIDSLSIPLPETQSQPLRDYFFGTIESPAGPFSISVSYRSNCDFRVENSEAILSSQFIDEDMFKPSLRNHAEESVSRRPELGSLPQARRGIPQDTDQSQAYGSLSTFHNTSGRASSSPLGALRAAREMNAASSGDSTPVKAPPSKSPPSSRASLRSEAAPGVGRRTSVSFMPFKSPSLSASPLQGEQTIATSPRNATTATPRSSALTTLAEARNPGLSQQKEPPAANLSTPSEAAPPSSVSSSPRPTPRYSSSFGHRRAKPSTGGSKGEEDNNSSGKASVSSSNAQPGSGLMTEGGRGSSGSLQTDDDNISDFLKMLDQKKDLKSFRSPSDSSTADAAARRTTVALSKFQKLKESNAVLSDSMSSSMMGHRSSSSSSRQLSSVPPMVAGTSVSTSSSPGERMSPRTPHTPAIPSRLSANSIIDYNTRERSAGRRGIPEGEEPGAEGASDANAAQDHAGAIDIPTSPRSFHPSFRRSSSVAQQHRAFTYDDENLGDILPFGIRSASLGGADEREPLSLSALLAMQEESGAAVPILGPANNPTAGVDMNRQRSSSSQDERNYDGSGPTRAVPYRPRIARGLGRGHTPPHGSSSSLAGDRGTESGGSDQRSGRYSFPRSSHNFEDEEPLLFAMSELGTAQQGRRSLEDGRRGSTATGSDGGETASRRGSRRGMHGWS